MFAVWPQMQENRKKIIGDSQEANNSRKPIEKLDEDRRLSDEGVEDANRYKESVGKYTVVEKVMKALSVA